MPSATDIFNQLVAANGHSPISRPSWMPSKRPRTQCNVQTDRAAAEPECARVTP